MLNVREQKSWINRGLGWCYLAIIQRTSRALNLKEKLG